MSLAITLWAIGYLFTEGVCSGEARNWSDVRYKRLLQKIGSFISELCLWPVDLGVYVDKSIRAIVAKGK